MINEIKSETKIIELNSQIICEKLIEEAVKSSQSGKFKRDNMTLVIADLIKYAEIEKIQQKIQSNYYFFNE